jgi:hypothetical protein
MRPQEELWSYVKTEKPKKILHTILIEWDQKDRYVNMRFNDEALFSVRYDLFERVASICIEEATPDHRVYEITEAQLDKSLGR